MFCKRARTQRRVQQPLTGEDRAIPPDRPLGEEVSGLAAAKQHPPGHERKPQDVGQGEEAGDEEHAHPRSAGGQRALDAWVGAQDGLARGLDCAAHTHTHTHKAVSAGAGAGQLQFKQRSRERTPPR